MDLGDLVGAVRSSAVALLHSSPCQKCPQQKFLPQKSELFASTSATLSQLSISVDVQLILIRYAVNLGSRAACMYPAMHWCMGSNFLQRDEMDTWEPYVF